MAGRGPAPKPAEQRRRRNAPTAGEWVDLPREGRQGEPPAWILPIEPDELVRGLWEWAWGTPQAAMWEGLALEPFVARWCVLTVAVNGDGVRASGLQAMLPELRQIEDRLGLNPKGLQDRRWRLAPGDGLPETGDEKTPAGVTRLDGYRAKVGG